MSAGKMRHSMCVWSKKEPAAWQTRSGVEAVYVFACVCMCVYVCVSAVKMRHSMCVWSKKEPAAWQTRSGVEGPAQARPHHRPPVPTRNCESENLSNRPGLGDSVVIPGQRDLVTTEPRDLPLTSTLNDHKICQIEKKYAKW